MKIPGPGSCKSIILFRSCLFHD